MKRLWLLALAALAGCAVAAVDHPVLTDEALFDAQHPYYAEICALSGIDKKPGFGAEIKGGGPGGHMTLYLNNVCRDETQAYPVLKLCDASTPADKRGAGISANAHFLNTHWVAAEGRDFLYRGTLPEGAPLTREAYRRTQIAAEAQGVYEGVTFQDEAMSEKPGAWPVRDWMYELSVGTDYASGFARSRYCARVPLTQAQTAEMVRYLNADNAPYRSGAKTYRWNVVRDNCAHLIHNALAAAEVWPAWPENRPLLIAAFDFPVPANELVNLMGWVDSIDLTNPEAIYRDPVLRRGLMQDNWLPAQPGFLLEAHPAAVPNEIYDKTRLIFYDNPVFGDYEERFDSFFGRARYTDLRENLRYYADLYRRVEAQRRPVEDWPVAATSQAADFRVFYERYYRYIAAQRRLVDAWLAGYP